jgi:DNA-binding SARP family transcriptional activator
MRTTHPNPERRAIVAAASPEEARATPDQKLHIRLLGPMAVLWGGTPIRLATAAARGLVALLALRGRLQFRETVAADLWPDLGHRSTAALRQALWLVRGSLQQAGADSASIIDADEELIGFFPEQIEVDAIRFEHLLSARPRQLEEAVSIYRGDLALTCGQECFARERDRLADLFEDALVEVARSRIHAGDYQGAHDASIALLARDPLREEGHAALIEVYGQIGSRSQVTRQYRRLCSVLETELSVPPLPETEAAYRAALGATYSRSLSASETTRRVE